MPGGTGDLVKVGGLEHTELNARMVPAGPMDDVMPLIWVQQFLASLNMIGRELETSICSKHNIPYRTSCVKLKIGCVEAPQEFPTLLFTSCEE